MTLLTLTKTTLQNIQRMVQEFQGNVLIGGSMKVRTNMVLIMFAHSVGMWRKLKMTIKEIREWGEDSYSEGTSPYLLGIIDTLLAALDEKEERLAIKDDALCAATMVGEFVISKLKVATEALERIESGDFINSAFSPAKVIAAAALKEIEKEGGE